MVRVFISNLHQWDKSVCLRIFNMQSRRIVDNIMYFCSRLGDGYVYVVIAVSVLILNKTAGLDLLVRALPAFGFQLIIQKSFKHTIKRERPCYALPEIVQRIVPPDEFSFPSGHTAGAFLMATVASSFLPVLSIPAFIIAALVGLSRIYNGVHYPGDVLAGMCLGFFSARLSLLVMG